MKTQCVLYTPRTMFWFMRLNVVLIREFRTFEVTAGIFGFGILFQLRYGADRVQFPNEAPKPKGWQIIGRWISGMRERRRRQVTAKQERKQAEERMKQDAYLRRVRNSAMYLTGVRHSWGHGGEVEHLDQHEARAIIVEHMMALEKKHLNQNRKRP